MNSWREYHKDLVDKIETLHHNSGYGRTNALLEVVSEELYTLFNKLDDKYLDVANGYSYMSTLNVCVKECCYNILYSIRAYKNGFRGRRSVDGQGRYRYVYFETLEETILGCVAYEIGEMLYASKCDCGKEISISKLLNKKSNRINLMCWLLAAEELLSLL